MLLDARCGTVLCSRRIGRLTRVLAKRGCRSYDSDDRKVDLVTDLSFLFLAGDGNRDGCMGLGRGPAYLCLFMSYYEKEVTKKKW